MYFKSLIIIIEIISILYNFILFKLNNAYITKPLPDEVKDIYDSNRYKIFIEYRKDKRQLSIISSIISLILLIILLYSPFYTIVEKLSQYNTYLIVTMTIIIIGLIESIIEYYVGLYDHFVIEEKYNKNKMTKSHYLKMHIKETLLNIILLSIIINAFAFVCENVTYIYITYALSFTDYILLFAAIILIVFILYLCALAISYYHLKTTYKFTPLQDGKLKDEILYMLKDSPKKVKKLLVYNESEKSVSKNAFVLKLPFYREISIADNFINENDHKELLAILSHEIGHLKHKKSFLEYLKLFILIIIGLSIFILLYRADELIFLNSLILKEFNLITSNYYLTAFIILHLIKPLSTILSLFNTYLTRVQEYEADYHAIKQGYGEALIQTFKQVSHDQLINVYPHPIVEFFEYDHPSMYNRIKFIKKHL